MEVKQLFPHLQEIVSTYAENFNGVLESSSLAIDDEVTESDFETYSGSKAFFLGTYTN